MNLGVFVSYVNIPERILRSDQWCTPEWILANAYFPCMEPHNPQDTIQRFTDEGLGPVPKGCRDFIRGEDKLGRGDIELWYKDVSPIFSHVDQETVEAYRAEQQLIEMQYLRQERKSKQQIMDQIVRCTSLLPIALIVPHPRSVSIMDAALRHRNTRLHW